MLASIHAAGPADAAAPEAAANVLVHNRALLRNKRLLLAYVCVPLRSSQRPGFSSRFRETPVSVSLTLCCRE